MYPAAVSMPNQAGCAGWNIKEFEEGGGVGGKMVGDGKAEQEDRVRSWWDPRAAAVAYELLKKLPPDP